MLSRQQSTGFTLVEMLVALAVGSIIVSGSYASYVLVANQYEKIRGVADMHTSGRAIMRIIERDIRMAGFVWRDDKLNKIYGDISEPLKIVDSGNNCCDEITLIYDYHNDTTNRTDRVRTRYWVEEFTGSMGTRGRLYKRRDILGRGGKTLSNPIMGNKNVMADYIEDIQFSNSDPILFMGHHGDNIWSYDLENDTYRQINSGRTSAMAAGKDGLLYTGYSGRSDITIYDPITGKSVGSISSGRISSLSFGENSSLYSVYEGAPDIGIYDADSRIKSGNISSPKSFAIAFGDDGLLYRGPGAGEAGDIKIIDPDSGGHKGKINSSYVSAIAYGPDGNLYAGHEGSNNINIYNPKTKEQIGNISNTGRVSALAVGNGSIYAGYKGSNSVRIYDLSTRKRVKSIRSPRVTSLALNDKSESLVDISLILRTEQQYGANRNYRKKVYLSGNYLINRNDGYKRDEFSTSVLVRNLSL